MDKINLGDEVQHIYTNFKGIAVARTNYLSGCDRITVQPTVNSKGEIPEANNFDEPECKIIKKKKVKVNDNDIGGFKPEYKHYLKD